MADHRSVNAAHLPKPAGPYSLATVFERLVFVAGQGAKDPLTDRLVASDIEAQTEQCLKNIQAILEACGSSLQHVLRCGVFLIDIKEFAKMNAVYARMFGEHRPARTTIQAAALPAEELRVEIDCIAYVP
ncbi:MAG TPA: Rid family detoxifying hydrolase [Vicinamibacterales bacterium]